jgi:hypothetical protein
VVETSLIRDLTYGEGAPSWSLPGAFLEPSWSLLGAFLGPSWSLPGAFLEWLCKSCRKLMSVHGRGVAVKAAGGVAVKAASGVEVKAASGVAAKAAVAQCH